MDLRIESTIRSTHCVLIVLSVLLHTVTTVPAPGTFRVAEADSLEKVVLDLQNVLYRLENYALKRKFEDATRGDPSPELAETESRDMEDHSYPEIVEGVYDKKVSSDVEKELPVNIVPPHVEQKTQQTDDVTSDISLKDALDYLVKFAKEKKQERRDHDIPFPLNAQPNQPK